MSARDTKRLHDEDYVRLLITADLSKTIDGLLVGIETFLFALTESRRYGINPEEELRYYLRRPESERILQGILSCKDSFEYLVFETPRFKLIRSYYSIFVEALEEYSKKSKGLIRPVECLSRPVPWEDKRTVAKEVRPSYIFRSIGVGRPSTLELLLYLSLVVALAGVAIRIAVG